MTLNCYNFVYYGWKRLLLRDILKSVINYPRLTQIPIPAFWEENLSICLYHVATSYRKTPVLEPLFNSKYFEIFKSTYFEEHFQTAASENKLFIKKKTVFWTSISETSENVCYYFMIGFSWSLYSFFFGMVRNEL